MRAAVFLGPRHIEVAERPDPAVTAPMDALVRVVLGCVCGSDLWYYRGESPHALGPIGHEFIGVVEQVGTEVRGVAKGELVIAPFKFSDGTCAHCRAGWTSNCIAGAPFGTDGIDGGQGEAVRVPFADGTLVPVPGSGHSDELLRSLLTLSDVMATAFAAAGPGSTVGFVGVPHGVEVPIDTMFARNIGLRGGAAPVRRYIPELLDDVLEGRIHPERVFDFETKLDGIGQAYAAMDERRAIKSLVRVGTAR